MIGVWICIFLRDIKLLEMQPRKLISKIRIVELGGGRGSLMNDLLVALNDLKITHNFDLNFVEIS
jgi:SAM-dependent MidA family methyltransferase